MLSKVQEGIGTNVSWDWRADLAAWERKVGRKAGTLEAHQCDLNVFCDFFSQATGYEFSPELINSFDLLRFRQWSLETQGVRPATWNRRLASLHVLAEWMRRKTDVTVPEDLFEGIGKAEEVEQAPEWLTDQEFERLGRYIESSSFDPYDDRTAARRLRAMRDRGLAAVMVYAGLREMEAANLLVGDVSLSERKGAIVVRSGKRGKRREIPLTDAGFRKILRRWLDARGEISPEAYLFPNDQGGRLSERAIQDAMGAIGSRCKIEDLRPHRLRHTFGKRLVDAGVQINVVADLMGHASLEVTRRYVRPGREDLREAVRMVRMGKSGRGSV